MIVAFSLIYHYLKEWMRTKERLMAIGKGIYLKDIYPDFQNTNKQAIPSKRESEIYGRTKILIIGLHLALALYFSEGADSLAFSRGAIWGIFVAGIGLAKIFVGLLMKKREEEH